MLEGGDVVEGPQEAGWKKPHRSSTKPQWRFSAALGTTHAVEQGGGSSWAGCGGLEVWMWVSSALLWREGLVPAGLCWREFSQQLERSDCCPLLGSVRPDRVFGAPRCIKNTGRWRATKIIRGLGRLRYGGMLREIALTRKSCLEIWLLSAFFCSWMWL